ncbi:MAG: hypothetical protein O9341_16480, partial [Paucibacter sp.]|nr:hypothetical protein [Roseateles sp.]
RRHESYTWASTNWQSRLLIGDSLPYESKVPRVRLAMEHYGLVIYVNGKLATIPGGKTKDSTILLFLSLLLWKKKNGQPIFLHELTAERTRIRERHKSIDLRYTCEVKTHGRIANQKFFEDLRKKLNSEAKGDHPFAPLAMPIGAVRKDKRTRCGVLSVTGSDSEAGPFSISFLDVKPDEIGLDASVE